MFLPITLKHSDNIFQIVSFCIFLYIRVNSSLFILFVLLSWCLIDTTGGVVIHSKRTGGCVRVCHSICLTACQKCHEKCAIVCNNACRRKKSGVRTLSIIEHIIVWHFSTSNSHFNVSHLRFLSFHVRSRLGIKTETAMLILRCFCPLPTHFSTRDISRSSFNQ